MALERATDLVGDGDLSVSYEDLNRAAELFEHAGVVVFEGAPALLETAFLEQCRREFEEEFAKIEMQLRSRNVDLDKPLRFNEVVRRLRGRYDVRGLQATCLGSQRLALENAPWKDFVQLVIGEDATELWRGVVLSQYGSEEQNWHRDGGHLFENQHLPAHCVTVFVPLVATSEEMGRTSFYPGSQVLQRSHQYNLEFKKGRPCSWLPFATPAVDLGSWLVFDYRIVHRGCANEDHDLKRDRPMLYFVYAKPWFTDAYNFPTDAPLFLNHGSELG
ncbi:unnamed protein product [Polarella glacialis]|uniref:Phytanoyl-CoA dioxygenase n=1 Tax=Polarella glacialis TaxID=89957 RepID=A0A813DIK1_POLGL|nr:unnamed protein product [Polarella glacialis]